MKTETFFSEMLKVGKRDLPPRLNVVNQVMVRIQSPCLQEVTNCDFLTWTAALSTGVAVVLGLAALCIGQTSSDPLLQFILALPWGSI